MSSANFIISTPTQRVQRDPGFRRGSTAGMTQALMVSTSSTINLEQPPTAPLARCGGRRRMGERQRAILGHSFDGAAASAAERSFRVCDTIAAIAFTHTLIICRIAFTKEMTSFASTAVPTGTAQIL